MRTKPITSAARARARRRELKREIARIAKIAEQALIDLMIPLRPDYVS